MHCRKGIASRIELKKSQIHEKKSYPDLRQTTCSLHEAQCKTLTSPEIWPLGGRLISIKLMNIIPTLETSIISIFTYSRDPNNSRLPEKTDRRGIDRGKKNKTLNKVKPVESKNKNPQSFRGISLVQMEISGSHKEISRIN